MKSLISLMLGGLVFVASTAHAITYCHGQVPDDRGCWTEPGFSIVDAKHYLGKTQLTAWVEGNTLHIAAIDESSDAPRLAGSVEPYLQVIGTADGHHFWGVDLNLPHLAQSRLQIQLGTETYEFMGPAAPPLPEPVNPLKGRLETISLASRALGASRQVTIYTPKAPPPLGGYPVIYAADGYDVASYAGVIERLIDDGAIQPVLVVGIWAATDTSEGKPSVSGRNAEYDPGLSIRQRFVAHDHFVTDEVMPLVESRYHASSDRTKRMTFGFSDGAVWAIAYALRHPDRVNQVAAFGIAGSPDSFDFTTGDSGLRIFAGAGAYDPFYYNAQSICAGARRAERTCGFLTLYSGHDNAMRQYGLVSALRTIFPGKG